jgi:uncharacterized membrane protein YukC
MIVANMGKITELIEHRGNLKEAHEKALLYVSKGKYKVKRLVETEIGVFWKDIAQVGDYEA